MPPHLRSLTRKLALLASGLCMLSSSAGLADVHPSRGTRSSPAHHVERVAQAAPDSRETEKTFWDAVKDSGDPDMIDAYLASYPHGKFAEQARAKLGELRGETGQQPQSAESIEPKRFDNPEIDGGRLDSRPAAGKEFDVDGVGDAFCQRMGYPGKIDYHVADVRRTIAIEDGTRFKNKKNTYSSFRFIECGYRPAPPAADDQFEGTWASRSAICGSGVGKIKRRSDRIVRIPSADRSEYFRLGYGYDCGPLQIRGDTASANCKTFYFPKGAPEDSGSLELNAEGDRMTGRGPDGIELALRRCE